MGLLLFDNEARRARGPMVIRAACAVQLGFGLLSPLHDSIQDIFASGSDAFMLCSFPALRGRESIYSARRKDLGRSSEGAVYCDKLSQAMQRGIRPIRHYAQTVGYLQS